MSAFGYLRRQRERPVVADYGSPANWRFRPSAAVRVTKYHSFKPPRAATAAASEETTQRPDGKFRGVEAEVLGRRQAPKGGALAPALTRRTLVHRSLHESVMLLHQQGMNSADIFGSHLPLRCRVTLSNGPHFHWTVVAAFDAGMAFVAGNE